MRGAAAPFTRPPQLTGADVAERLASLRRLQSEGARHAASAARKRILSALSHPARAGAELAHSPLPQPAGEPCTPARPRLELADSPAPRAPPLGLTLAGSARDGLGDAPALSDDEDGGGAADGDAMSGFRRVAAAGFADAPPSAQELQAQKARRHPRDSLAQDTAADASPDF